MWLSPMLKKDTLKTSFKTFHTEHFKTIFLLLSSEPGIALKKVCLAILWPLSFRSPVLYLPLCFSLTFLLRLILALKSLITPCMWIWSWELIQAHRRTLQLRRLRKPQKQKPRGFYWRRSTPICRERKRLGIVCGEHFLLTTNPIPSSSIRSSSKPRRNAFPHHEMVVSSVVGTSHRYQSWCSFLFLEVDAFR